MTFPNLFELVLMILFVLFLIISFYFRSTPYDPDFFCDHELDEEQDHEKKK